MSTHAQGERKRLERIFVMGWTDDIEKVETVKKLWLEGISAANIARRVGGITRNQVLGKVTRLKLSGRAVPSQPVRQVLKTPRSARQVSSPSPSLPRAIGEVQLAPPSPAAVVQPTPPPAAGRMQLTMVANPVIIPPEDPRRPTVLTLGAGMCKWPIGDPAEESFCFCGKGAGHEGPYCVEHAKVAYQPKKVKESHAAELARSLRRYM